MDGPSELDTNLEDALYEAVCDDATFSISNGRLYAEFSRTAPSLKDAILGAIQDIRKARKGITVLRVDDCDLVTAAEIARRSGRSRQLVHQYITGERGAGDFPPPICRLEGNSPYWEWCSASYWLAQNNIIRPEQPWNAEVIATINTALEAAIQQDRHPDLVKEVQQVVKAG